MALSTAILRFGERELPRLRKRISDTERTVKWPRGPRPKWMSKKEYRRTLEFIEMRLRDVTVETPGFRSEGFTIATTLLDVEMHPGAWLCSMYGCNRRSAGSLLVCGVIGINKKRPTCHDSGVEVSDSQRQGGRQYEDRRIRAEMQHRTDRPQYEFDRRSTENRS